METPAFSTETTAQMSAEEKILNADTKAAELITAVEGLQTAIDQGSDIVPDVTKVEVTVKTLAELCKDPDVWLATGSQAESVKPLVEKLSQLHKSLLQAYLAAKDKYDSVEVERIGTQQRVVYQIRSSF